MISSVCAGEVGQPAFILQDAVSRYQGHPYAIQAALDIVQKTKRAADLPHDPTSEGIAARQWQQICRAGKSAIRLFEAYAILEVAVPRDIVRAVSGLDVPTLKRLLSDSYLRGLLREAGQGQRIYHAILADHVRCQIDRAGQQALHIRAIDVYRTSLKEAREQNKAPDALAAVRLPEHVLAAEGPSAFVVTFVNECNVPLLILGLLDVAIDLLHRCRESTEKGSQAEAVVIGNQAVILKARGDYDRAMSLHKDEERIWRQLANVEGLATSLVNQASALLQMGRVREALPLAEQTQQLATQHGYAALAKRIEPLASELRSVAQGA